MIIPHTALAPDTLRGIVEEYVTREGTEYGAREYTLDEKVERVLAQIQRGEVVIDYDPDSSTCNLLAEQSRSFGESTLHPDMPSESPEQ